MNKKSNKKTKKIRNLILLCFLCTVVLSVATYAWFIGMKTVNVNKFDINIATTEGLFLSMDGETWSYNLDVTEAPQYTGNTNKISGVQLIPLSSVGDMDSTSSTMKLFEKGSLTATKGGYRLLASRVNNYTASSGKYPEGNGYVAFDLFIKNLSGVEYYADNNVLNEEAIYLTTNSSVTVATDGGVAGTGIENSVRVAFVQLGRTKSDSSAARIIGMNCSDVTESDAKVVTGICRDAQIWEPNDAKHEQNALNWYNESCLLRGDTDDDVRNASNYTTACPTLSKTVAYPTYAISRELLVADNINIYDGTAYNGYEDNTVAYATYAAANDKSGYKLVNFPYFTDTMKDLTGTARPQFMTLAPNSVTKIRVYIWIEGQDIDNYDFASLGHKITVNFGFTKERYTEADVSYDNLKVQTQDTTYQAGKLYYTLSNSTYTLLVAGSDYQVGDSITGTVYEATASTNITPNSTQEITDNLGNVPSQNQGGGE